MLRSIVVSTFVCVSSTARASPLATSFSVRDWVPCLPRSQNIAPSLSTSFECAIMIAPLCYTGICNDTESFLTVSLKRIRAMEPSKQIKNVWVMEDFANENDSVEEQMAVLHVALKGSVGIYTANMRGRGDQGTILSCTSSLDGSLFESVVSVTKVASCAQELGKSLQYLAAFSLSSSALDIRKYISRYQSESHVYMYGVGYGSIVMEKLLHFDIKFVRGFVFDSSPLSDLTLAGKGGAVLSELDQSSGRVGQELLALCDANSECASHFAGNKVSEVLRTLLENSIRGTINACVDAIGKKWNAEQAYGEKPADHAVRMLLARMAMDTRVRLLIAPLIRRIERCERHDLSVLIYFLNNFLVRRKSLQGTELVRQINIFSELWEQPPPSSAIMRSRFEDSLISTGIVYDQLPCYCAFRKDTSHSCRELMPSRKKSETHSHLSYTTQHDKLLFNAISPSASILQLHGTLNPFAPYKNAKLFHERLKIKNKKLVTFPFATHNIASSNDPSSEPNASCGLSVFVSYINNNGIVSKVDSKCTKQLQFDYPKIDDLAKTFFASAYAFDGDIVVDTQDQRIDNAYMLPLLRVLVSSDASVCSKEAYKITVICIGVALALLCLGSLMLYIRWRSMKQLRDEEQKLRCGSFHRAWSSPECFLSTPGSVSYM